ncbi:hypothetical protein NQ036_10470 [Brevibacterium sp. 91QC2O2]|uniref:hypothetical protein n=1 Tax=Brevibacterium sp. 91QC2O2 TaxID=2968458 RepID=UPI00211C4304|nr:hypothetical protein [Brevibacterium sp. 91QC2O2]MCQ9368660.1 hypothetical protein [Brevibacterium sp. 91QC2O2]
MSPDAQAGSPARESPAGQPAARLTARRPDLLALTDDALAALANRGLVKRAAKDLAKSAPQVAIDEADTVTADFADGTHTVLGSGGLEAGTCSCSASGVCRHLVGTVLAVRALAAEASDEQAPQWSPADVDDAELLRVLGKPAVDAAHRRVRAGLRATVLVPDPARPATGDNAAAVDLPTTTVRFLVPGALGYAHTDVVATERGEQVALAVLAFRAAQAETQADAPPGPGKREVVLGTPQVATDLRTPFEPALEFVTELVDQGVRMLAGHVGPRIAAARAPLAARGFQWPLDVLDELAEQLEAYAGDHAGYAPGRIAELTAELVARATAGPARPTEADRILGTRQPARTAMRRARFLGLGARVSRTDDPAGTSASITTRVYLADADAGAVLVLSTSSTHQTDQVPAPDVLARRRVGGLRLGEVSRGSLTTESATRTAGLRLQLSAGRAGRSTVTTGPRPGMPCRAGSWWSAPRTPPGSWRTAPSDWSRPASRLPPCACCAWPAWWIWVTDPVSNC